MSKSTKTKSPAAPRVKKTAAPKKAAVKKAAAAKKPAAPAKKKTVVAKVAKTVKKAVKTVKKVAVKKATTVKKAAVEKKTAVKKTVAKKAPAKKKSAATKKTVITAKIDIAFGNTLYIRGEGPGLSWDAGVPMNSIGDDEWSITLPGSKAQVIFKFLVNDISWNSGEDYVVDSGSEVVLVPSF